MRELACALRMFVTPQLPCPARHFVHYPLMSSSLADAPTYARHYKLLLMTTYMVCLVSLLALLYVPTLTTVDTWVLCTYVALGIGVVVTGRQHWLICVQVLHILYSAMFVLVPLLAKSPCVLAVHLVVVMSTLALRAECDGECPVNTMECDSEKIYNESLVDKVNFNTVFWCSGAATLVRWLWMEDCKAGCQ